ncbi:MAG: hypothetical protein IJ612_06555 [Prevotella sp.]|nr:hypothetical protein [Prevotella sp.]
MKSPRPLLSLLSAVLLMAACAEEAQQDTTDGFTSGQTPVTFGAARSAATRTATGTIADLPTLQSKGFGVFACHTGLHDYANTSVSPDFMFNQQVAYNGGTSHWEYAPLKYWPVKGDALSAKVSFFAYAPYADPATDPCITGLMPATEQGDPYLIYRLAPTSSQQVDLLFATPLYDQQCPADATTPISFTFHHALACIGDKVSVECTDELATLLKTETGEDVTKIELLLNRVDIDYTLTNKGKLVLAGSGTQANWKPVMSEAFTVSRSQTFDYSGSPVVLATITDASTTLSQSEEHDQGILYIPMQTGDEKQTALISVGYSLRRTLSNGTVKTFTARQKRLLTIGSDLNGEHEGDHTDLNIRLGKDITVSPLDIASTRVTTIGEQTYCGEPIEPDFIVIDDGRVLTRDEDYAVSFTNNTNAGTAIITITGIGAYDGEQSLTFNIRQRPVTIAAHNQSYEYGGSIATTTEYVTMTGQAKGHSLAGITLTNTQSSANAGVYAGAIVPSNATIKDGSGTDVTANYAISYAAGQLTVEKTAGSLSLSTTSLTFTESQGAGSTKTITVTRAGNGTISATTSNPANFSVSVSGTTVTVTRRYSNAYKSTATITVSVAEGTNHAAPASRTCAVTATAIGSPLPTSSIGEGWVVTTEKKAYQSASDVPSGKTIAGVVVYVSDGGKHYVMALHDTPSEKTYAGSWDEIKDYTPRLDTYGNTYAWGMVDRGEINEIFGVDGDGYMTRKSKVRSYITSAGGSMLWGYTYTHSFYLLVRPYSFYVGGSNIEWFDNSPVNDTGHSRPIFTF